MSPRLVHIWMVVLVMGTHGAFNITSESVYTLTDITTTSFAGVTSASSFLFRASPPLSWSKTGQWKVSSISYSGFNKVPPVALENVPNQMAPTLVVGWLKGADVNLYLLKFNGTDWIQTLSSNNKYAPDLIIITTSSLIVVLEKAKLSLTINSLSLVPLKSYIITSPVVAAYQNTVTFLIATDLYVVDCTNTSCTNTVVLTRLTIVLNSLAASANHIFARMVSQKEVLVWTRLRSGWTTSYTFLPYPQDPESSPTYGSSMMVSVDGNFLLVLDSALSEVNVYYYNATNWILHQSFIQAPDFGYIYSEGTVVPTSSGYVILIHTVPIIGDSYMTVFYVNCDTNSNGLMCTNCTCSNGVCDNSMWSSDKYCKYCNQDYYGLRCANKCSCVNGYCSSGLKGTGLCTSCFFGKSAATGWFDANCSSPCYCVNGICDSGITGSGYCLKCLSNYYNYNCSQKCVCNNTCYDGVNGNGTCSDCNSNQFGYGTCTECSCQNGTCNSGPNGDGYCLDCQPGFYGRNCNNPCACGSEGTCNSGISGDGNCSSCNGTNSGSLCTIPQTCLNGTPNIGINGNGTCLSCDPGFYGINCENLCACNATNGNCDPLTGECSECTSSNLFGPHCNQTCTCSNGICSSGVTGNGKCIICSSDYYGEDCSNPCKCNGTCYSGISGNGTCLSCESHYFGSNCVQCYCQFGTCNSGITGDGKCSKCEPGYFGTNCEYRCQCQNGTCDDGINGTGHCQSCENSFFGSNCNLLCECNSTHTLCENVPSNDVGCINECTLKTHNCEQICISRQSAPSSLWNCACENGFHLLNSTQCISCPPDLICQNNTVLVSGSTSIINQSIGTTIRIISGQVIITTIVVSGDMILLNSTARVLGHLFVTGNINSTGSTVSISDHSIMNVAGNLILKNGVFVMTGSSFINVSGCLDLSNVSLVLSGNPQSNTFNLMSFSPNCTNTPTYSHIAYDNPMECRSYTLTDKSTNKQIIFSISYDDSKCNTFQLWWVILLTLVVLIGLIILMYFSTKNSKIHKIFFPFSDRKKHQSQITASLYAASL